MKTIEVKTSTYINFDAENIDKNPTFKTGDDVRI